MKRKITKFICASFLSVSLIGCASNSQYQHIETAVQNNVALVDTLQQRIDTTDRKINAVQKKKDADIQQIQEKLVAIGMLQAKIASLESRIDQLDSRLLAQQEVLEQAPQPEQKTVIKETQKKITVDGLYKKARTFYIDGKYQESITAFDVVIKRYPTHQLAANAQYWIGECYYSLEQYETAIYHFDKIVINYPESEKVVDAKLKIAFCLADMNENEGALTQLREIQKQYPDYDRMNLVREKIIQIGNE